MWSCSASTISEIKDQNAKSKCQQLQFEPVICDQNQMLTQKADTLIVSVLKTVNSIRLFDHTT